MTSPPSPTPTSPEYEITNEVRFAVVMYGGVSLAIYINGVAQELLRLVRSTARWDSKGGSGTLAPGEISGTERVYRKLSHLLANPDLLGRFKNYLDNGGSPGAGVAAELEGHVERGDLAINTRFVVDIMSGTSAGGINAIYLAKALANDQTMDDLKKLWVTEGDIGLLINDSQSVKDLDNLASQVPPKSLLNSQRMYYKLLFALHEMGEDSPRKSPYVEDIDLFITATDIKGLTLPIQLADKLVFERRHRSVFHFRYSAKDGDNDFTKNYNPFLAFAARATSSFPFAFEPMLLDDIDDILRRRKFAAAYDNEDCRSGSPRWKRFFTEYLKNDDAAPRGGGGGEREIDFTARAFGDGGYLDNKPFSYSTATLARRHSNVPVDRKLIYIEPSPEHPEDEDATKAGGVGAGSPGRPDALANVKAALLDLPSYETIREDLQRVLERNRFLNRVNRIISNIEEDVNKYESRPQSDAAVKRLKEGDWVKSDLVDMLESYGVSYLPYHRLRIAAVRDDLASMVASARGYDIDSDYFLAIRCVIGAWRDLTYVEYYKNRDDREGQKTLNQFLADFDLNYQLRRLSFLRKKIDQLYRCSGEAAGAEAGREARPSIPVPTDRYSKELVRRLEEVGLDLRDEAQRRSYRETLSFIKCRLNDLYDELLALGSQLRMTPAEASSDADAKTSAAKTAGTKPKSPAEELRDLVAGIGLTKEHLNYVLSGEWREKEEGKTEEGAASRDGAFARLAPGALTNPAASECSGTDEPVIDPQPANFYCGEASYAREAECVRRAHILLDPLNADKFCLGELRERLSRAAEGLAAEIDAVVRRTLPGKEKEHSDAGAEDSGGGKKNRTALILRDDSAWTSGEGCARKVRLELLSPDYDRAIRDYLFGFYRDFDFYDQISFPVLFNTDVGEADTVEVIRVSPEDATTLIDERGGGTSRRKLAGTAFHHFGAFLDRVWRENDIMWGRLDGAERLVASLLPGGENERVRAALINEAHAAILAEEMPQKSRDEFAREVIRSLQDAKSGASPSTQAAVAKITDRWKKSDDFEASLLSVMRGALDKEGLLAYMKSDYEVDRQLDPKAMLRVVARSTQLIGKLFEDVANQNNLDGQNLRWIARLGQVFWGLVEVAVPHKLLNLFASYWLKLFYVFWVVVFFGSLVFNSPSSRNFAMMALLATGLTHALILVLRDHMRRRHRWLRFFAALLALLLVALAVFGGYNAYKLFDARFNAPAGVAAPAQESQQKK